MTDTPPAPVTPEMSTKALVARVWANYLSPQKGLLALAGVCAVVIAVVTSAMTAWLKTIDALFAPAGCTTVSGVPDFVMQNPLVIVPGFIVIASLIRFAAQRGLNVSLNQMGNSLIGRIQSQLFSRLVHADLGRLQQAHSGQYLSSVLYDADLMREATSNGVVNYVQNSLIVIASLYVMAVNDWIMTTAVILCGPIISFVLSGYIKRTKKAAQGAMAETSALSTAIMESLDGVKIIKISNREADEEARVNTVIERRQRHIIKGANARAMAAPATEALTGFLLAGLIGYEGWRAQAGGMTVGGFVTFLAALLVAGQAMRQLANLQAVMSQGMTAARRLFAALDIEPEITEVADAKPLPRDFQTITFDKASFSYGDAPVLKDVSFTARAGDSVALVGPSGSGKSTLLNLIPRFFDLGGGDIRFDGLSHRELAIPALRSRIALVTQDPFLFDDTIRANIAYGNPGASEADIEQAARDAAADEFITAWPEGYNTRVGEAGSRLSGGQKQRIAIARAFLKNAPLLLLDEATSALDTQSEIKVQQALERLMTGRTTFIIAHRLSTIRHADQILVLDQGQIVERGRHDDLVKAGGLYARLAETQFEQPIVVPEVVL